MHLSHFEGQGAQERLEFEVFLACPATQLSQVGPSEHIEQFVRILHEMHVGGVIRRSIT
jgi:hypothetical protein